MKHWGKSILTAALLLGLAVTATSCGSRPALTGPTPLANLADLTLAAGRPGNVWVCVHAAQNLSLLVVTERPLRSCTLSRVASSDGSAVPAQPIDLRSTGGGDYGWRTYAWTTTKPVAPGTYRVQLEGDGRIVDLRVEKAAPN